MYKYSIYTHITRCCAAACLLLAGVTAAHGAGAKKKVQAQPQPKYGYLLDVKRSSLAVADSTVVVSLQLTAKQDVPGGVSVILMPVLEDSLSGRRHEFPLIFLNSRNQQIYFERALKDEFPDAMALRKRHGEALQIDYLRTARWEPWMQQGVLKLQKLSCACRDFKDRGEETLARFAVPVAEPRKLQLWPAYIVPPADRGEKVRHERGSAYLTFVVDKTDIRPSYMRNQRELQKIDESVQRVRRDQGVSIQRMTIEGYASPEGSAPHNQDLSERRTEALRQYLQRTGQTSGIAIDAKGRGENWQGLMKALRDDHAIPQRQRLLDIADNKRLSADEREQRMRRQCPAGYSYLLHNVYPRLRCTNYTVAYTVRAFTLEESERVFETRPINLSLGEIYRLADKYAGNDQKYSTIMRKASLIFPDDPYINLTMAYLAIKRGDADEAAEYLRKSKPSAQRTLNEGLVSYLRGDIATALRLVNQAAAEGLDEARRQQKEFSELSGEK